jgi:hypothetical protein
MGFMLDRFSTKCYPRNTDIIKILILSDSFSPLNVLTNNPVIYTGIPFNTNVILLYMYGCTNMLKYI